MKQTVKYRYQRCQMAVVMATFQKCGSFYWLSVEN
jgi:hypothetical protein